MSSKEEQIASLQSELATKEKMLNDLLRLNEQNSEIANRARNGTVSLVGAAMGMADMMMALKERAEKAESELERARRELQAIVDESGELIGPSVHYSEGRLQKINSLAIAALKAANRGLGGE